MKKNASFLLILAWLSLISPFGASAGDSNPSPYHLALNPKKGEVYQYRVNERWKGLPQSTLNIPEEMEIMVKVLIQEASPGKYVFNAAYNSVHSEGKTLETPLDKATLTWSSRENGEILSHRWEGWPPGENPPPLKSCIIFPEENLKQGESWSRQIKYPGMEAKQECKLAGIEKYGEKEALNLKCSYSRKNGKTIKEEDWIDPTTGMILKSVSVESMEIQGKKSELTTTVEQI